MATARRVAVLVETSGNIGREIIAGIAARAREAGGWELTIEAGDATRTTLLPEWRGDGIICRSRSRALAEQVAACDLPRVVLGELAPAPAGQRHPQIPGAHWGVGAEPLAAAACACLAALAPAGLAFCDHPEAGDFGRAAPFLAAAAARGLPTWRWTAPRRGDRRRSLAAWLAALPPHCAIWAADDAAGLAVTEACRAIGRAIPADLLVLGCNDDEFFCAVADPQLSSIAMPAHAAGRAAIDQLAALLDGRRAPPPALPAPRLVRRASTEFSAAADPLVAAAASRLAGAATATTAALARSLGVSVRALERRCRAATGATPGALRRRQRLEAAEHLLISTDLSIEAVAQRCGFASATRLGEALRRATGLTPTAWRRQWRC